MKKVIIVFSLLILCSCTKIEIKEDLNVEINSEVKYSDLVIENEKITLLEGDKLVNTSILGESKVVLSYLVNDKPKYKTIYVNVVDTTKPVIKCDDTITITKGKSFKIDDYVKVTDNSKEEIKANASGEFDINKAGTYKLQVSAKDSSGNTETKEVNLTIKNLTVKTSGYYVYKAKSYIVGISFKKNNKVTEYLIPCLDACGYFTYSGKYSIKNDTITNNYTSYQDESGSNKMNKKDKCTIKSESKIVCGKETYKWTKKLF